MRLIVTDRSPAHWAYLGTYRCRSEVMVSPAFQQYLFHTCLIFHALGRVKEGVAVKGDARMGTPPLGRQDNISRIGLCDQAPVFRLSGHAVYHLVWPNITRIARPGGHLSGNAAFETMMFIALDSQTIKENAVLGAFAADQPIFCRSRELRLLNFWRFLFQDWRFFL